MRAFVVDGPEPVLTLTETKQHLKVESTDEDLLIEGMTAAAQGHIDGPLGWLGRAIGVQTIEARFDNWDCGSLRLPYPPHIEIVSVVYIDAEGGEVEIDAAGYELLGASLQPAYGVSWPSARWQREAVRVRYRAGYETVPAPVRAALLLMVGDLYAARETFVTGTIATALPMSTTVEALLSTYRVFA